MKNLAVLGSTGSVGTSTLDVVRQNRDLFNVEVLLANSNFDLMMKQYEEFSPKYIYLHDSEARKSFLSQAGNFSSKTTLLSSEDEIENILESESIDIVVAAMVGVAGLVPVYQAVKNGKNVLLANKESYVVAGELLNNLSAANNSTIFPIDSEHSAIHQCLQGVHDKSSISRLILTGSGGPFLHKEMNEFSSITPKEAVAHPIWSMGKKISVDSSTMMNKCLEVIEARWLFNNENIDVLIHPEGLIHSLVEFKDNSMLAQLSVPDMKIPIAYGLGFPEKINSGSNKINFEEITNLTFMQPDYKKFPSLGLANDCLRAGGTSFTILNAVNEVCVDAFLKGKIAYLDIYKIISKVLDKSEINEVKELGDIFEADIRSRKETLDIIKLN
jgi:1-deoxy-D-xylulose-5-phosphate reductoisomerase